MPAAIRSSGAGYVGASSTSHSLAAPPSVVAGDVLLAEISYASSATTTTPPAGWTLIASSAPSYGRAYLYAKVADSSDAAATSFTFSLASGKALVGRIHSVSGVVLPTTVHSATRNQGTAATTWNLPGAFDPYRAGIAFSAAAVNQGGVTPTSTPTGWTALSSLETTGVSLISFSTPVSSETYFSSAQPFTVSISTQEAAVSVFLPEPIFYSPLNVASISMYGDSSLTATTLTLNLPPEAQPGDLMIAAISWRIGGAVDTPAGWTAHGATPSPVQAIFSKTVQAGDTSWTWTYNSSGNSRAGAIALIPGGGAVEDVQVAAITGQTQNGITYPSATSQGPGRLVLHMGMMASAQSYSPPTGETEIYEYDTTRPCSIAGSALSSVGPGTVPSAFATSSTSSTSGNTAGATVVVRPNISSLTIKRWNGSSGSVVATKRWNGSTGAPISPRRTS